MIFFVVDADAGVLKNVLVLAKTVTHYENVNHLIIKRVTCIIVSVVSKECHSNVSEHNTDFLSCTTQLIPKCTLDSGRSRISHRGRQRQKREVPTYYSAKFSWKVRENEENWTERWARSKFVLGVLKICLCRSPLVDKETFTIQLEVLYELKLLIHGS